MTSYGDIDIGQHYIDGSDDGLLHDSAKPLYEPVLTQGLLLISIQPSAISQKMKYFFKFMHLPGTTTFDHIQQLFDQFLLIIVYIFPNSDQGQQRSKLSPWIRFTKYLWNHHRIPLALMVILIRQQISHVVAAELSRMCKFVTWSDYYFSHKSKMWFYNKIWTTSS